ncbi:hypothetical protein R83H12_01754 [Fibrobacteria bacterium R8-3-H12]
MSNRTVRAGSACPLSKLLTATLALAMALTISCTSDIELPPPPPEYSSSAGKVLGSCTGTFPKNGITQSDFLCLEDVPQDFCSEEGGTFSSGGCDRLYSYCYGIEGEGEGRFPNCYSIGSTQAPTKTDCQISDSGEIRFRVFMTDATCGGSMGSCVFTYPDIGYEFCLERTQNFCNTLYNMFNKSNSGPSASVNFNLGARCSYSSSSAKASSSSMATVPSSSSVAKISSSSSSLPIGTVWCMVGENCVSIAPEACAILGGQQVQNCPAASSSSSVIPSSSSSSVVPIVPSSSSPASGTSGTFTDSRDSKVYKWVKIGTQTWMAENLNYNAGGSRCYNDDPANCDKYGRMYNLVTAIEACPSGWHLPTKDEWDALTEAVGGSSTATRYLKATSGWFDCGPVGSGSSHICEDKYGFAALPGGYSLPNGYSSNASYSGLWWSATKYNDQSAYRLVMDHNTESTSWDRGSDYYSVRCFKN